MFCALLSLGVSYAPTLVPRLWSYVYVRTREAFLSSGNIILAYQGGFQVSSCHFLLIVWPVERRGNQRRVPFSAQVVCQGWMTEESFWFLGATQPLLDAPRLWAAACCRAAGLPAVGIAGCRGQVAGWRPWAAAAGPASWSAPPQPSAAAPAATSQPSVEVTAPSCPRGKGDMRVLAANVQVFWEVLQGSCDSNTLWRGNTLQLYLFYQYRRLSI